MAEKNGIIEKALNSNYLNVQKEELAIGEKSKALEKEFSKNIADNLKNFKAQQKDIAGQKKDTVSKFKSNLNDINSNHKKHLEEISKNVNKVEKINEDELEKSVDVKVSEEGKLNKAIEKFEKEYVKQVADVLKKYESEITKSNKEKDQVNSKTENDVESLKNKLQELKDKHEQKVVSLNEKKTDKIDKLTESSNKKIDKVNADILKEETRINNATEELKPVFEEKLAKIEDKIALEKNQFDTKYTAIKSTLESKVARHEKFMNKNLKDNDMRAAKQHKKEIAVLQKNADKELKLLTNEHNDRSKVVKNKKRVLVQENLESIASFTKKLIQFREEKLYQIESFKAILNNDVELLKFNTDSNIQDAINKFNENERDNLVKLAKVLSKQGIDLEQEVDNQNKLLINFDKDNSVNDVKQQSELVIKEKELKTVQNNKEFTDKLSNLNRSIELSKLDNESKVALKELILDIKVNEENQIMEFHNLDFVSQGNMSLENLGFQTEIKSLYEARQDALLAYEDLEATNRAELKIAFLEAQKVRVTANNEVIIAKIENAFEAEQVLYDDERESASSKDLEELKIYEAEGNDAIKKITDKRNALDPKAYKKEIKDLDQEINVSREELNSYVKTKRENITSNTSLFDKGIEDVKSRRENSIEDNKKFFNEEITRLDAAINLVENNKNNEINDAKNRHLKTFENTAALLQNAQLRNNSIIEQTTSFKMSRIQNENDVIKDFKDIFEKQKFGFKETLDDNLSDLDNEIQKEESNKKDYLAIEEASLENKVNKFNKLILEFEDIAGNDLDKQSAIHKENYTKVESKESIQISNVNNEFIVKENEYKLKKSEIDKASSLESKSFDLTKKVVKKDYEASLSKKISDLNTKLQLDIRAL